MIKIIKIRLKRKGESNISFSRIDQTKITRTLTSTDIATLNIIKNGSKTKQKATAGQACLQASPIAGRSCISKLRCDRSPPAEESWWRASQLVGSNERRLEEVRTKQEKCSSTSGLPADSCGRTASCHVDCFSVNVIGRGGCF